MDHYLEALFQPESVAVVGVSATAKRSGDSILETLRARHFGGRVYAVGRSGGQIDGEPIYTSIDDLPEVPTLIFCAVGMKATPQTLVEAAAAGVKIGIVFTAGFAEMNADGARVEADMIAECNRFGMRVVGPNCMGVFDNSSGINLTSLGNVDAGPVGFVSQSGNIALTLFQQAKKHDLGFQSFVSFGNQADIPAIDYIEYMGLDDSIEVILMYLEGLQEDSGVDFIARCRAVARKKPIVAIKGGVTDAGLRAAASHTSRLSSTADTYEAAFKQAGIIQVKDLDHVLAVTGALLRCPPMLGDNVAIVGSGGGHSTIGTDCVEGVGLTVPPFKQSLKEKFSQHLPPWAPMSNPVDMTGGFTEDLALFTELMRYPLSENNFDGGLSYGLYGDDWKPGLIDNNGLTFETAAPLLGTLQKQLGKPIVFYTPYAKDTEKSFTAMRESGVPCYGSLAEAATALAALRERGAFLNCNRVGTAGPVGQAQTRTGSLNSYALTEYESLQKIAAAGLATVKQDLVSTSKEAIAAADKLGYPVVMKAQLANVAHKSDVNGVRLGLTTAADVGAAFIEMSKPLGAGNSTRFTVSQQVPVEREILLGIRRDQTFGHVLLFGIGGLLTEVASRVAVLIPPMGYDDFVDAIDRSPIRSYLGEWRGRHAVNMRNLHKQLIALHGMCIADETIESVDVNPLATIDDGIQALDATVVVRSE